MPEITQRGQDLLERDGELRAIEHALAAGTRSEGALICVEGAAGIGKTRLLEEVSRGARRRGWSVCAARGLELERESPLGLTRRLFERESGVERAFEAPVEPHAPVRDVPFATLHRLYWLVADMAEVTPVALVVDDAQWADLVSLRFLAYLAPRLSAHRVVLAVARRVPGAGPESERLLGPLTSDGRGLILRLRALSGSAVRALVAARTGVSADDRFVAAVESATGGVPFLVEEVVADVVARGLAPDAAAVSAIAGAAPEGVGRSVAAQLARLPDAAVALARAAAVLGDGAEANLAAQLADMPPNDAEVLADQLAKSGLIRNARPLEFTHPLLRQAVYDGMGAGDRAVAHGRAAQLVRRRGGDPLAVAAHLLSAPPTESAWGVDPLRRAAAIALASGGAASAVAFLKRASQEATDAEVSFEVRLELGRAEALAGATGAARADLEAVLAAATSPEQAIRAALELHRVLFLSGCAADATAVAESVGADLDAAPRELRLRVQSALYTSRRAQPSRDGVGPPPHTDATDLSGRTPGERELLAHVAFAATMATGDSREAAALALRALAGGRLLNELGPDGLAVHTAVATLILTDDLDAAGRELEAALTAGRTRESIDGFAIMLAFRSALQLARGRVLSAVDDADQALRIAREHELGVAAPFAIAFLLDALIERGELEVADCVLERATATGPIADIYPWHLVLERRGRLRLRQRRHDAAVADLREAGRRLTAVGRTSPLQSRWRSACALALRATGEPAAALELAHEELALAEATGSLRAAGAALASAGALAGDEPGLTQLKRAVELLSLVDAPLELGHALLALGSAIRRGGRRSQARMPLRAALDLAERCRASALARSSAQELILAGGRPRRRRLTGSDALTPGERRVAEMAAAGATNRAIAEALFVTVRTVESHLTAAYAKLGIRSRTDLAHVLSTPSGSDPRGTVASDP